MRVKRRAAEWKAARRAAWILAGLLLVPGAAVDVESSETGPAGDLAVAREPSPADREVILTLVRDHRRTAGDAWRRRLAEAIYEESVAAGIDPLMVASIVASESSFKSRIVSRAGAIGLMQLRPFVAREIARREAIDWRGASTLHDPELNVRLGILYYKELFERFDGDETMALTAYNYGPSRVDRQLRSGAYRGSDYAERILVRYEQLRGDHAATRT